MQFLKQCCLQRFRVQLMATADGQTNMGLGYHPREDAAILDFAYGGYGEEFVELWFFPLGTNKATRVRTNSLEVQAEIEQARLTHAALVSAVQDQFSLWLDLYHFTGKISCLVQVEPVVARTISTFSPNLVKALKNDLAG